MAGYQGGQDARSGGPPYGGYFHHRESNRLVLGIRADATREDAREPLEAKLNACKQMYALGHEPALARLSELANIDACQDQRAVDGARKRRKSC